ncbi:MAG: methylmalonyl-CoA epimerase [Planctomycetes bacterium]|nr:methylmalonyl-CoA epimerase [Planctomycetota bacterium]
MINGIHHVAIAVAAIDPLLPLWTGLLGFELKCIEHVADQRVRVAVLMKGTQRIELVEPAATDSPVNSFLAKRGPGLHHVCLDVEGLVPLLASLEAAGMKLIDKAPRPGAEGRSVAFVHPAATGGVLLELSEAQPRVAH